MQHIEVEINAQNPNKSIEGMHSIVFDVIKQLTELQDQNMIITSIKLNLEAEEGPGIKEYEQFEEDGRTIIVDKSMLRDLFNKRKNDDE